MVKLFLLTTLLLFISFTTSLSQENPEIDSLQALLDPENIEQAEASWEWMEGDNMKSFASSKLQPDVRSSFWTSPLEMTYRYRSGDLTASTDNYVYQRLMIRKENYSATLLLQRDKGEKDIADLTRFSIEKRFKEGLVILGDFRLQEDEGWIIGSRAGIGGSLRGNIDPKIWKNSLYRDISSEEGYGWRGIAGEYRKERLILRGWGGVQNYDSRYSDSGWLLYSTQGDHSSTISRNFIQENHLGFSAGYRVVHNLSVQLISWQSSFSDALSSEQTGKRYGELQTSLKTIGTNIKYGSRKNGSLSVETATQGAGANLFRAAIEKQLLDYSISLAGYRITSGYAVLHSRPSLPYGSLVNGSSGVIAGIRGKLANVHFGGWWSQTYEEIIDQSSGAGKLYFQFPLLYDIDQELRFSTKLAPSSSLHDLWYERLSGMLILRHNGSLLNSGVRVGAGKSVDNDGFLFQFYSRSAKLSAIVLEGAIAYYHVTGGDVYLTTTEMVGPGVFPVRLIFGNALSSSAYFGMQLKNSLLIWTSLRSTLNLDESVSDKHEFQMKLGLEWQMTRK
ncbi:hypothetical protein K8I28_11275 [bacterium]|nr:hypothetical protein [bacterium]